MEAIKEALTFDDVLLLPRFSRVLPSQTDISLHLTKKIQFESSFLIHNLLLKLNIWEYGNIIYFLFSK